MFPSQDPTAAVRVRKGCKNYGEGVVLQDLDMTVPSRTIYTLLGSSGCGKTTLLSALVGLKKLGSGSIHLFGKDVSQTDINSVVGYMPQETGLHPELKIAEELHYFGRLYDMKWSTVEDRINFLVNLLQLEGITDSMILNMSGGQARRVSLAVAVLHKPQLIILDEPTVGIDPLLRQSIWEHLYELVKDEGATIIVSTHYTEEARQADVVSVMRNGRLLVEENPASLMERFNSEILEDIVVKLCRSQDMENSSYPSLEGGGSNCQIIDDEAVCVSYKSKCEEVSQDVQRKPEPRKKSGNTNWGFRQLKTIYAMFVLNLIVYKRHPALVGVQLFLPINDIALGWTIYKQVPDTDVGIVNLEQPNCLNLPEIERQLGCELSVFFHESNSIKIEEFLSEESALAAVHRGRNYGYLVIPENFSDNMVDRVSFGRFADGDILDGSSIAVHLDYSNFIRKLYLHEGLVSGLEGFVDKKLNESGGLVSNFGPSSFKPFKINEKMNASGAVESAWSDVAAVTKIAWWTCVVPPVWALLVIWDKKQGSFYRTMLGGGSLPHFFIATMGSYFFIYIAKAGIILLLMFCLNIPVKGSILDFFIVNYGQNLVGLSYGLLLAMTFNQELEVIFMVIALSVFSAAAQGGVTSLESIGYWMQWFVVSLPVKVPSISLENIIFRGWALVHPEVWPCFIVQGAWIILTLFLAGLSFYNRQT